MENNIRQIRQVFKNLKMQVTKNSDSREMSRKSSRVHSRRGSIDFLEEEEEDEECLMRSKSGSIFGSRDELYSRSRTRSGDEMGSDDDDEVSLPISMRPHSRRPSIISLPTGRWSRRSSLAGNEFFKMDDEMVQVHRSGSTVSIPRKLSHHVPIVPIIESQDYEKKLNLEFQSMDSEEFQLYKTANVEQYNLVKSANFEIVGKPKFPPKKKAKDPTEDEGNESSEKLEPKSLELMEELLRKGVSLEDMPEAILSMANKDLTELEKKQLCEIIQKGVSSGLTIEDIMKSQGKGMGEKSKEELEEMLRSGSSLSAVIKHFLTPNTTEEQTEQGFQDKMHRMLERQDLTQEEKLNVLFSNLKNDEKQLAEDWLKSGKSLEDIVQLLSDTRAEKESKRSVSEVLNDESLSLEEKFCLLKGNMNKKELDKIQNLIESGLSIDEALKAVAAEEDNESEFQKKIKSLAKGKDLNPTEMLELIKEYLSEDEMERCEEMMRNKYKTEDIIQYFLKFGTGRVITEFETLMRNMMEGKEMSDEEMLELLKSNLGPESLLKLEEMLGSGFSHSEVIKFMIRNGRTKEMEEKETKLNIENLLKDEDVSLDEKVKLVKGQLNEEAKFAMEELLKQGYKTEEVMDLFLRCANDISLLNSDGMFKKTVRFSDEPPDAFLYEARDVWSMIDQCEVKLNVPFMTNLSKCGTFTHFFGKVVKVTTGKDLTHREILDVIAFRLGGDFAVEFEELRYSGYRLQEIVDHFLMKDEAARLESMRRARLRANTRREAEVRLQRAAKRDNWGVRLSYCQSEEAGLQLRVDQVTELGPAYRSGLRAGNTIVTVDDWLITLMDRPQVACNLFQAGCNMVRLGIMKTENVDGDSGVLGIF